MSASLSVILFAIAEAIARRGLPEPKSVDVDTEFGLRVTAHNRAETLTWAKALRCTHLDKEPRVHTHTDGARSEILHLYGTWHGANVTVGYSTALPAEEPAEVAA
jgi:hypothetical protein